MWVDAHPGWASTGPWGRFVVHTGGQIPPSPPPNLVLEWERDWGEGGARPAGAGFSNPGAEPRLWGECESLCVPFCYSKLTL